jgi:glucose-1-phosphate cytidylyltransferase
MCLSLIRGDDEPWEAYPMRELASRGQLMAFEHRGFWQAMDTLRDKTHLELLWDSGHAPWKRWG